MIVSDPQKKLYERQGFLLVPGLIQGDVVQRAYDSVLKGVQDRTGSQHAFSGDRAVVACFSDEVCQAARDLSDARKKLRPPSTVYTIVTFPTDEPWQWPSPHIDHSWEKDRHKTFPPPFHIGCLIYLNDVASKAAPTVVWPQSHGQLEAWAGANRKEYEYMFRLNRDLHQVELEQPIEITARAGDALFYHYLCAHAGSANTGATPRVALNHKW